MHPNEWSWNLRANMVYLESPAGVGYSYGTGADDLKYNDMTTSQDNLKATLAFFDKFP